MSEEILTKANRQSYWNELYIVNAVERMRSVVKQIEGKVDRLASAVELLEAHSHVNGKMVIDFFDGKLCSEKAGRKTSNNPGEVYF